MKCPKCGGKTKVQDTRHDPVDGSTYRRLKCEECLTITYSSERIITKPDSDFTYRWARSHRRGFVDLTKEAN